LRKSSPTVLSFPDPPNRLRRADRILTKAASLHTRGDALGKALRETLKEVRLKLRSKDPRLPRSPTAAATADTTSAATTDDQDWGNDEEETNPEGGGEATASASSTAT
jgi:hypothetical protein